MTNDNIPNIYELFARSELEAFLGSVDDRELRLIARSVRCSIARVKSRTNAEEMIIRAVARRAVKGREIARFVHDASEPLPLVSRQRA